MTADTNTFGPGSTAGAYRIIKEIGSGGMGTVFEGMHSMLSRRVAIKVLHLDLVDHPNMAERMAQEASILEDLRHPGIVRIFDCGVLENRCPWIAMELVFGDSLATRLAPDVKLSPKEVCKLLGSLADVLATVHARGIVHRDLKPDNILFAESDDECSVRIIDWGVARIGLTSRLTLDGSTYGTPTYMSPEQVVGKNIASPCDIYSLGVIAYEALAGHPPFEGTSLAEVVSLHLHGEAAPLSEQTPAAPKALCDLIHRMLQKAPWQRPTAPEIRDAMWALSIEHGEINVEFESYDLNTTTERPVVEADTRLRWTPALPALFSNTHGTTMIRPNRTCLEVSGEISKTH